jgi:hypothetical protein
MAGRVSSEGSIVSVLEDPEIHEQKRVAKLMSEIESRNRFTKLMSEIDERNRVARLMSKIECEIGE